MFSSEEIYYQRKIFVLFHVIFFNLNSLYQKAWKHQTSCEFSTTTFVLLKNTRFVIVNHGVDRPDRKIRVNAFANCSRMNDSNFQASFFPGINENSKGKKKEGKGARYNYLVNRVAYVRWIKKGRKKLSEGCNPYDPDLISLSVLPSSRRNEDRRRGGRWRDRRSRENYFSTPTNPIVPSSERTRALAAETSISPQRSSLSRFPVSFFFFFKVSQKPGNFSLSLESLRRDRTDEWLLKRRKLNRARNDREDRELVKHLENTLFVSYFEKFDTLTHGFCKTVKWW